MVGHLVVTNNWSSNYSVSESYKVFEDRLDIFLTLETVVVLLLQSVDITSCEIAFLNPGYVSGALCARTLENHHREAEQDKNEAE